jgi:hypothetical protein
MRTLRTLFTLVAIYLPNASPMLAASDNLGNNPVWTQIRSNLDQIAKAGGAAEQMAKSREILNEFRSIDLKTASGDVYCSLVGRLCAALFTLGEKGDLSDIKSVVPYVAISIPSQTESYDVPLLTNVSSKPLTSPRAVTEQRRFPACYALSEVLKRNSGMKSEDILNSAGNDTISPESELRILGALVDAKADGSAEYASRLESRFAENPKVLELIKQLQNGGREYWDARLVPDADQK